MSRRQHTTLKLSVSLTLPAGMPQKRALEHITEHLKRLCEKDNGGFIMTQAIIKLEGKHITYL